MLTLLDRGAERGGGRGGGVRSSSPLIASCDRQWRWCVKELEKNEPVRFFPPAVRDCATRWRVWCVCSGWVLVLGRMKLETGMRFIENSR